MARGTLAVVLALPLLLIMLSGCLGGKDAGSESLGGASDAPTGTSGGIQEDLQNALNRTQPPTNVTTPRWWTLAMNNLSADGTIAGFVITVPRDALVDVDWYDGDLWAAYLEVVPFAPEGVPPDALEYWGFRAYYVVENESTSTISTGRHRLQSQVGSETPVTEPASQTPLAILFSQDSNATDMTIYVAAIVDAPSLKEFALLVRVRGLKDDGRVESLSDDLEQFLYRVRTLPTTVLEPLAVGSGVLHARFSLTEYSGLGSPYRSVKWSDDVEVELTPAGSAAMSSRQLVLRSTLNTEAGWSSLLLWRGEALSEGKWSLRGHLHDKVIDAAGFAADAPYPVGVAHGTAFGSGASSYRVVGPGDVDVEYRLDVQSLAPSDWLEFDLLTLGVSSSDLFGLSIDSEYGGSSSGLVGKPPL